MSIGDDCYEVVVDDVALLETTNTRDEGAREKLTLEGRERK